MADINVTIEDAQPISVSLENAQPIDVSLGEAVNNYLLPGPKGDKGDKGDKGNTGTTDYNALINLPDLTLKADKSDTYTKIEVDTSLAGKAELIHVHAISDVTGLQTALDGKSATNHTHTAANVTDFDTEVSNNTDVAANTAARHTHANKTLLDTYSQTEANIADAVAKKHSHTNSAVLDATTASFTTADETKLDGIAAGAQVNTVTSVNTRTGVVVLDADDISDTATTNKFVTAAEKTKLSNLSGTNTGDNLIIGTTTPTPSIGAQVLWLDTTGGNITLNLVTGE